MTQIISPGTWQEVCSMFRRALGSSFHFSLASINEDGSPHVTPIGSLILRSNTPAGFYMEKFATALPKNLSRDNRVCVMAVNSSRVFWLRSLLKGSFDSWPAIRLVGTAGERRPATEKEIRLWQRRVRKAHRLRGHDLLWRNMKSARDIQFSACYPVNLGKMTKSGILRTELASFLPKRFWAEFIMNEAQLTNLVRLKKSRVVWRRRHTLAYLEKNSICSHEVE